MEIIFIAVFTVILIYANIYSFKHGRYLYLFVPCILFLPDYYALEINESLPIISASRIMFLVFYIYAFINRRRDFNFKNIEFEQISKSYYFLGGYFILRVITNIYYVTTYGQAIKTILGIVFEQLLFLVAIYIMSPTREEIQKLVKVIVAVASIFFVLGVFESFTFIRPFNLLYTVSRDMLNDYSVRLGLLRATTSLGFPGMYGNMCILILPLILYLYEVSRKTRYLFSLSMCLFAIIHSGSRADIIFLLLIVSIYFLYILRDWNRRYICIKNILKVGVLSLTIISILSVLNPYYRYFYVGTVKSVLNEIGFHYELDEEIEDEYMEFGRNPSGKLSRIQQISGIKYASRINPIFGLGSGAQNRVAVKYYIDGEWRPVLTYDLGVVEMFCDEGILGLLGVIFLLIYLLSDSKNNRWSKLFFVAYVLTTLSTVNMFEYLFIYIIVKDRLILRDY